MLELLGNFPMIILKMQLILDFTDPDFNEMIKKLDKDKYYIIYCKSGIRSD